MHVVLLHPEGLLSHRRSRASVSALDTHKKELYGNKRACHNIRKVQGVEDGSQSGDAVSLTSEPILSPILFIFARTVRPVEYQRKYHGFNAGQEGRNAKIDVVVRRSSRRVEELSVQKMKNYLRRSCQ